MLEAIPEEVFHWVGYCGVVFYLGAYALLQTGLIRGSGYPYTVLNLIAATFVLIGLTVAFNLSSAIIQVFWIAISLIGLSRMFILNHTARLNPEESDFIARIFPEFSKTTARKFLNQGIWLDTEPGFKITRESEPVTHLTYLADGTAGVFSGSQPIGTLIGGLIGEMNVMQQGPASATVVTEGRGRIFMISSQALNAMAASDVEFRHALESGMSRETRSKLVATNKSLLRQKAAAE